MNHSTHYNLNLAEGTDLVNPLTVDVPNYQTIDSTMYANEQAGVGTATELKSGTIHAITRANQSQSTFKFRATSNFVDGDTFTVDGSTVTALNVNGSSLTGGCFIIGSEVLCSLVSTQLTIMGAYMPTATDVPFDDTDVFYTASNVQDAIEKASTASGTEYNSGSSVKDNLDGITITGITSNTYVVGSYSVVAFKVGKLAVINIKEITFNANVPDADYVVLRNLPIPTTNIEFPLTKLGGSGDVSKRLRVNTNGELQNWYSTLSSGETLFGTLVYQIA